MASIRRTWVLVGSVAALAALGAAVVAWTVQDGPPLTVWSQGDAFFDGPGGAAIAGYRVGVVWASPPPIRQGEPPEEPVRSRAAAISCPVPFARGPNAAMFDTWREASAAELLLAQRGLLPDMRTWVYQECPDTDGTVGDPNPRWRRWHRYAGGPEPRVVRPCPICAAEDLGQD